jgi:hypothetical protein
MSAQNSYFLNGTLARVLFAVLAVILAIFAWFQYQQIGDLKADKNMVLNASEVAAMGSNPAVASCAETRFAQIDQRVADGFLDAELVAAEREHAMSLCIVRVRESGAN